ncbi:g013 [Yersinia phage phiR1-37]|uniref:hypothetical protein n=1 Tax=Yersinia phage phiR1-37 TaxID=331278 RepID=UPI00022DBCB9|nr:hypothetical protein phiR1-37_gp013 [Yersinia phage phiR1-37]CCE26037.1 g013 [Yersinia phage phiR1-37]
MKIDKTSTKLTLIVPASGIYAQMEFIDQYIRSQKISKECISYTHAIHVLMELNADKRISYFAYNSRRGVNIYTGDFKCMSI